MYNIIFSQLDIVNPTVFDFATNIKQTLTIIKHHRNEIIVVCNQTFPLYALLHRSNLLLGWSILVIASWQNFEIEFDISKQMVLTSKTLEEGSYFQQYISFILTFSRLTRYFCTNVTTETI